MVLPAGHWKWTPKKRAIARSLASGKSRDEVAEEFDMASRTIDKWFSFRDCDDPSDATFAEYVDKLTFKNEMASTAGIIRRSMRMVDLKEADAVYDKNTLLEYLKMLDSLVNRDQKQSDNNVVLMFKQPEDVEEDE